MAAISATYRLQFHRRFTLRDALEIVPYLAELGVSHVYASPLLAARSGSSHGYDVCDPTKINPEIGTEADLRNLVEALRARNMGLVLDIVPNHMSASPDNAWWWDVLQHGRGSRFATYFDIEWEVPGPATQGKVLLPVFGDQLPAVLERKELRLTLENNRVLVRYFDHRFPTSPESIKGLSRPLESALAELNACPKDLGRFLEQQHYRLAHSRLADQAINYRRFFNIADLAGLRVEDPQVFEDVHSHVLQWYRDNLLDGLRVDHPDGLHNPEKYLKDLRDHAPQVGLFVEKILVGDEALPSRWPVQGTTGYDFLNRLGSLFIDPKSQNALTQFYSDFTNERRSFQEIALEKKRLVLRTLFPAELGRLLRTLRPVLAAARQGASHESQVREALIELAACFPVYRTYVRADTGFVSEADVQYIETAATRARQNRPELAAGLDFLRDVLLLRERYPDASSFVMLFQQLTGPAMAKGVEDTAFYCFNRFVALNEVGGNPGSFGMTLKAFHDCCHEAQRQRPQSLLASTTHDTKRSEDVRARLALLSEIPDDWAAAVRRWSAQLEKHRQGGFPDRNAEYLFYQTVVGAWPLTRKRALAYIQKAAREAKEHTSWSEPNADYEKAIEHFVAGALEHPEFVADLERFVAQLIEPGWLNSLAQTLIKLTAPGIPDFYQGTELWDLSLVDPDNRRPVDFALRRQLLETLRGLSAEGAWQRRPEGLPKLWLIWRTLLFRTQRQDLFGPQSSYEPLIANGEKSQHVVAFIRGGEALTIAPRLVLSLKDGWSNTTLTFPAGLWQNELTSEIIRGGTLPLSEILSRFPVAFLSRIKD